MLALLGCAALKAPLLARVLFALYAVVCLLAVTAPGYSAFGNRVEPMIFGLPFVFAWNVFWVLGTFVASGLYYLATERHRE